MSEHRCRFVPCRCKGVSPDRPEVHDGRCCAMANTIVWHGHRVVVQELDDLTRDFELGVGVFLHAPDQWGVRWRIAPEHVHADQR